MRRTSYISEDVLNEIFVYLAIETTDRFKAVSKAWHKLLSDPRLRSLPVKRSARRTLGLVQHSPHVGNIFVTPLPIDRNHKEPGHPYLDGYDSITIHATCGGVMFLEARTFGGDTYYFVCNPSNGSSRVIPSPPRPWLVPEWRWCRVLRGIAKRPPPSNAYEIINIKRDGDTNGGYDGSIYSSETGTWTEFHMRFSPNLIPVLFQYGAAGGAFSRGSLHWLAVTRTIVVFDLRKRRLWQMHPPIEVRNEPTNLCLDTWLGSVDGDLYLLFVRETVAKLWILENYVEAQWKTLVEIECPTVCIPAFFDGRRIAVVDFQNQRLNFFDTHDGKWEEGSFPFRPECSSALFSLTKDDFFL